MRGAATHPSDHGGGKCSVRNVTAVKAAGATTIFPKLQMERAGAMAGPYYHVTKNEVHDGFFVFRSSRRFWRFERRSSRRS
jgi:hypothetical protein